MSDIYYDPYEVYGCVYCQSSTPNETKICDKCQNRYEYCSINRFLKWISELFN
jgi:hypothetical protein